MIIALSQLNFLVGDLDSNTGGMIRHIEQAKRQGADLVVFSELSVCGYPPADLLNFDGFVKSCLEQVELIAGHCRDIAAIVGSPSFNTGPSGKRLYNSAFLLADGEIRFRYDKGLLPTYDVFEEYRYFEPATTFRTVSFKGHKIAITICEDLWDVGPRPMYPCRPMDELSKESPDFVLNISASPFSWNRGGERLSTFSWNARHYKVPIFLVNQVGANTDLIFDGGSAVFNASGMLTDQFEPFREDLRLYDLKEVSTGQGPTVFEVPGEEKKNALLLEALSFGLKDYFRKSGLKRALVGLSGGLDSALTLVIAERALGRENVWAVLLPGPFSSDHSLSDARELAEALGVRHDVISIGPIVESMESALKPYFGDQSWDISEENLQARARAVVLMGLANKFGLMLLNTSNKSESAVGYGTLYGDMCGGLSVIGDIYKTEAYSLARYINRDGEIIPQNTLDKPPSAELKPDQKDTDSLPEYELLDPILFKYIEREMDAETIVASGHPEPLVRKVLEMVNFNEFKRKQAPPALRVSQKGFGCGRRMPIVASYPR
jgi:NAD+ synthase (glutamine-hydrolysing)